MTVRLANGTVVNKATMLSTYVTPVTPEATYTVNQPIYRSNPVPGEKSFETANELLFTAGQVVSASQINAVFPAATITSVTPATGLAAGGTAVTIKGTNFSGATSAALGGVNLTSFVVVNNETITGVSGAHAAGAVAATVADDSGAATLNGAFTYA